MAFMAGCSNNDIPVSDFDADLLHHEDPEIGQLQQGLGGVAINSGWGLEDGTTDIIPSSGDRFYWYPYNDGTNDDTWDTVSLAVASIDAEVAKIRMPHYKPPSGTTWDQDEVLLSVSLKAQTGTVPSQCQDTGDDTPCTLGMTQCLSSITSGKYDLCTHYRISLYWGSIQANTAAKYPAVDPHDVLYSVTRHEITHAFGFMHGTGGPMANGNSPLNECQLEALNVFKPDLNSTTWTYVQPSCQQ
jgi:hypothetical protein